MYDGGPIAARLREPRRLPADPADDLQRRPRPPRPGGAGGGLAEALLITALSAALPGLAHLRARRIRTGSVLLVAYALALTGAIVTFSGPGQVLRESVPRVGLPAALAVVAVVQAGLWVLLLIHSYAVLRPVRLSPAAQLLGGTAVAVMCLLVIVPACTATRYGISWSHVHIEW